METRSSIFSYFSHRKRLHRRSLASYNIIAIAASLFTLLFLSPQAFAASTQNQYQKSAHLPLSWSCGNSDSGHCYGVQAWGGANGADTRISLNTTLNGGTTQNDLSSGSIVTTEMWLQTGGAATYWVEAGIISDYLRSGSSYPFYFWFDSRPNGGGHAFHYLATIPNGGGNALVRITRSGSSNWNVLIQDSQGSLTGTSTNNNITIGNIVIGTELHNNYQTAHEPITQYTSNRWLNGNGGFQYQGNDGTWQSVNSPVRANWYNGQDPLHSSTGGDWYTCIPGYGC